MRLSIKHDHYASGILSSLFLFVFANTPAYAKSYTRSCTASYYIHPTSVPSGRNLILPSFTGRGTIGYYAPNTARKRARRHLDQCVNAHWRNRHINQRPTQCTDSNQIFNYPFNTLQEDLRRRICTANPGQSQIIARVGVSFHGQRGCDGETRGVLDPWGLELDSNMRFICGG